MRISSTAKIAAVALGLSLAGAQAIAAPNDDDHRRWGRDDNNATQQDNNNRERGERNRNRGPQQQQGDQNANAPYQGGGQVGRVRDYDRHDNDRDRMDRRDNDRDWNRYDRNDRRDNDRYDRREHRTRDTWRDRNRHRFDVTRFYRNYYAPRRFHIGVYHAPRGYYYRRWSYGDYLPSAYYGSAFWLTNFIAYGLFTPPDDDLIWVRYGPDALLVDRYTGEIIQVRYNVFY